MQFNDIKNEFFNGAKIKRKPWECHWVWRDGTIYKVNGKEWFNMFDAAYKQTIIEDILSDDWEIIE